MYVYKHRELDFKLGHSEFTGKKDRGLALWLLRAKLYDFVVGRKGGRGRGLRGGFGKLYVPL